MLTPQTIYIIVLLTTVSLTGKYYVNALPSDRTSKPPEMTSCESFKPCNDSCKCPNEERIPTNCGISCKGGQNDRCNNEFPCKTGFNCVSDKCTGCIGNQCTDQIPPPEKIPPPGKRITSEDSHEEKMRKIKKISKLLHIIRQMNENA